MTLEYRQLGEIRETSGEGIVDAYLTRWGTVDSYKSTFLRGAFRASMERRGAGGIRLLWNHGPLAGQVLEAREDEYGPFVRTKFNLKTTVGKDSFEHVAAGDVRAFSFGFFAEDEGMENGIRQIKAVDLVEVSPVIFPANEQAKISAFRSMIFGETFGENDLRGRGHRLINSLLETLEEILYSTDDDPIPPSRDAIREFQGAYLEWLREIRKAGMRSADFRQEWRSWLDARKARADDDGAFEQALALQEGIQAATAAHKIAAIRRALKH